MANHNEYATERRRATSLESVSSGVMWTLAELRRVIRGEGGEIHPDGRWRRITNTVTTKEWTGYGCDVVLESASPIGRKWAAYVVQPDDRIMYGKIPPAGPEHVGEGVAIELRHTDDLDDVPLYSRDFAFDISEAMMTQLAIERSELNDPVRFSPSDPADE